MVRIFVAALVAVMIAGTYPAVSVASERGLTRFAWDSRVLLIFAASGDPDAAKQDRAILADTKALDERDLIVLHVAGDDVKVLRGKAQGLSAKALRDDASIRDAAAFSVVLIGKDGGVKLRASKPVAAKDIFGLIDSMPMRANEARR